MTIEVIYHLIAALHNYVMIASLLLRNIFLRFESLVTLKRHVTYLAKGEQNQRQSLPVFKLKLQSTRTSTTSKILFKKYERMHKKELFVFESLMKFELSKLSNAVDFQHSLFVESFLELTGHHFVYTSSFSQHEKEIILLFNSNATNLSDCKRIVKGKLSNTALKENLLRANKWRTATKSLERSVRMVLNCDAHTTKRMLTRDIKSQYLEQNIV
ncbi:hypothetical protein GQX74_001005 [Glossina fuscipes]|nr:hypothetical protein GQX74_001005 [Glossina fuscipes]